VSVIAPPLKRDPDHATRGRSAHFVRVSRVHTHDAGVQWPSLSAPCPFRGRADGRGLPGRPGFESRTASRLSKSSPRRGPHPFA
jgi:hypothetical protein